MTRPTRVVVADDHAVVRTGLRSVLHEMVDVELVAEAQTGEEAVTSARLHRPDLVVMDLHMPPGMNGLEATKRLRLLPDPPRVLVLTMNEEEVAIIAALQAGACGYLVKGASYDEVTAAITAAATGEAVFGAAIAEHVLGALRQTRVADAAEERGLSTREREILVELASGKSTDQVAQKLQLRPKTVRNNVSTLMTKLSVPDRAQAIAWARGIGLR
jgi:DNA-binding NarL/FixJ family response regulator